MRWWLWIKDGSIYRLGAPFRSYDDMIFARNMLERQGHVCISVEA